MKVNCTECGLEFMERPARIKRIKGDTIFCSIPCRTIYRHKTLTEFQQTILEDIKSNEGLTIADMAFMNSVYRETVTKAVLKLLRLKLVKKTKAKRYVG